MRDGRQLTFIRKLLKITNGWPMSLTLVSLNRTTAVTLTIDRVTAVATGRRLGRR